MVDISRHLERAEEAVRKKNFRFAIQLFHQLLDLKPDHEEARRGLRQALDRFAAYRRVPAWLSFLGSLGPRLSVLLAGLSRRPASQARALERLLAVDPSNRRALLALGDCLERAQFHRSARVVFEHLAGLEPGSSGPWKRVGSLLARLGDHEAALAGYERALSADPKDQEALRARKNLAAEGALARSAFTTAGSTQELVKDREQARELERSQKVARTREDLEEELASLDAKLAQVPGDSALLLRKALVLRRLGAGAEAMGLLERLKAGGQAGLEALRLLGDLKLEALAERIRAQGPGCPPAEKDRLEREMVELRLGIAEDLVAAHPTDLGLRYRLGEALLQAGRQDQAIAEFQQAVKDPRFKSEALVQLARAFRGKGLADLAIAQYSKALETLGTHNERVQEVLYELGDLLAAEGRIEEALGKFSQIFAADINFRDVARRIEELRGSSRH